MEKMKGINKMARETKAIKITRKIKYQSIRIPILLMLTMVAKHSSPRRLAGEKKSNSYNHKTTIWVSHEYYLNPEFHKILSGAF